MNIAQTCTPTLLTEQSDVPNETHHALHLVPQQGSRTSTMGSTPPERAGTFLLKRRLFCLLNLSSLIILIVAAFNDTIIAFVSTRGSVLDTLRRDGIVYSLYMRIVIGHLQLLSFCISIYWCFRHGTKSKPYATFLGVTLWMVITYITLILMIWCFWDAGGRKYIRLLKFEKNIQFSKKYFNKRSGTIRRNWRRRKMERAYEDKWSARWKLACCCTGLRKHQESFQEIGKLFSHFFEDIDVVPSDILVGLILLRRHQKKQRREAFGKIAQNDIEMLSCGAASPSTIFLTMLREDDRQQVERGLYYMYFALACYGWPFYFNYNSCRDRCSMMGDARCTLCVSSSSNENLTIRNDNCCGWNYSALIRTLPTTNVDIVYASFHCDVCLVPFFVAVDHDQRQVVVSIRGTLSIQDVLTDLMATSTEIPVEKHRQKKYTRYAGHTDLTYGLLLVGHSLGGGVAAILSILLRDSYPYLKCICYAPPGGLLTRQTVEYTKDFVETFVVGKDCVARVGLPQLERLRIQIQEALAETQETKWRTILTSLLCKAPLSQPTSAKSHSPNPKKSQVPKTYTEEADFTAPHGNEQLASADTLTTVPMQTSSTLNTTGSTSSNPSVRSEPMYPPGRVIHIVRTWKQERRGRHEEPRWTAFWAENDSFSELLVSPVMVRDHMPAGVIHGLQSLLDCDQPEPRLYANLYSEQPVQSEDALTERLCILSPFGPPLATPERSDIPNRTISLLDGQKTSEGSGHRGAPQALLSSYDNLSREPRQFRDPAQCLIATEEDTIDSEIGDRGDRNARNGRYRELNGHDHDQRSDFVFVSEESATPSCTLNDIPSPYNFLDGSATSTEDLMPTSTPLTDPDESSSPGDQIMGTATNGNNGNSAGHSRSQTDSMVLYSRACSTIPEVSEVTTTVQMV